VEILNNKIKLFITDIDGVWTDGGMYYDQHGNELKKFNTYDSAGVLFLQLLKIPVAIITGENSDIVRIRAEKLKIKFIYQGVTDKLELANKICSEIGIRLCEVAFIGDDLNDIKLLESVGLSAAPANAPKYVKDVVNWNLKTNGGDGAFRAFVEKYLAENNLFNQVMQLYHNK
jgi:3-deoxy-D-manno-octulosonate 8-phosphate phosphatase (KDO 8-P phosphatase)